MSTKTSRLKPATAPSPSEILPAPALYDSSITGRDSLLTVLVGHIAEAACLLRLPDLYLLALNASAERLTGYSADQLRHNLSSDWDRLIKSLATQPAGEIRFGSTGNGLINVGYSSRVVEFGDAAFIFVCLEVSGTPKQPANGVVNPVDPGLRTLIDSLQEAVIVCDDSGTIRGVNTATEALFGDGVKNVTGINLRQLVPSGSGALLTSGQAEHPTLEPVLADRQIQVTGRPKNGHLLPLYLSMEELHQGQHQWFVGMARKAAGETPKADAMRLPSSAIENSLNAILLTDSLGVITYANQACQDLTGYTAEELIGKKPGVTQVDFGISEDYQRLSRIIQLGGVWLGDVTGYKKNGEQYWASEVIAPICDINGDITHNLIVQRDITHCIQDKQALSQSEERFRAVADMVGEWLWEQDAAGRYTWSSTAVSRILGLQPEEVLGRHYLSLLTPEDRDYWQYAGSVTDPACRSFHNVINRYLHRDGYEVYTQSSGEPLLDAEGRIIGWRGMDLDITAQKQVDDILRTQERAMEAASVGIAICDARQSGFPVIYANPALCAISGYARDELIGKNLSLLQGPLTEPAALKTIRDTLQRGTSCKLLLCNYRKNGTPFWNELLLSPVRDPDGMVSHYVGIQSDVTEQLVMSEERHQLDIAKRIQTSLLPKKPLKLPGIELAGLCLSAARVGGDYFDYFYRGDWLDIVIADVSGHNVGAALIMTELRSALRAGLYLTDSIRPDYSPAYVLGVLNELLYEDLSTAELFISMFYLRLDLTTGTLYYANAGHNRVLLSRKKSGGYQELDAEGMILGVHPLVNFDECSILLEPGDRLLLYTDGVVETQRQDGEFFGVRRLVKVFMDNPDPAPEATLAHIQEALIQFSGQTDFRDDITLVTATLTAAS